MIDLSYFFCLDAFSMEVCTMCPIFFGTPHKKKTGCTPQPWMAFGHSAPTPVERPRARARRLEGPAERRPKRASSGRVPGAFHPASSESKPSPWRAGNMCQE